MDIIPAGGVATRPLQGTVELKKVSMHFFSDAVIPIANESYNAHQLQMFTIPGNH